MDEVAKSGRTILFVSHNMNAIEELCDKCILLREGVKSDEGIDVNEVTRKYLFSDGLDSRKARWKNKRINYKNKWFLPLEFYIGDKQGKYLKSSIPNKHDAWVYISGNIRKEDPALTVGYALYDSSNNLLYWSYHTDTREKDWFDLKKGKHTIRSKIPERLLNEGEYYLELISSLHFRQWITEPGKSSPRISFSIHGSLSDSPYWMVKRPGILAPVIVWEKFNKH